MGPFWRAGFDGEVERYMEGLQKENQEAFHNFATLCLVRTVDTRLDSIATFFECLICVHHGPLWILCFAESLYNSKEYDNPYFTEKERELREAAYKSGTIETRI